MFTLFISTYNENLTIGLLKDDSLVSKEEKKTIHSHSEFLVPLIKKILDNNNLKPQDLNQILVVNGPGSFTGIRLGITVAKTLAYTLNIPIKTITSIEALACSIDDKDKIITISDNKGEYIGIFKDNKLFDLFYLNEESSKEYLKDNNNVYKTDVLNIQKIYGYSKNLETTNAHAVKAIYIKQIEALNDK